jgi:serine/threonine protein kinase
MTKTGTVVEADLNLIIDQVPENNNKVTQDYIILDDVLGHGAYGEVRKALHRATNELRAIKIVHKQQCPSSYQDNVFKEIQIMRELDHPNIAKIYEYCHDDKFIFTVMEFIQGGELFEPIMKVHHFPNAKLPKSSSKFFQLSTTFTLKEWSIETLNQRIFFSMAK